MSCWGVQRNGGETERDNADFVYLRIWVSQINYLLGKIRR